jgi:hypothetical protein
VNIYAVGVLGYELLTGPWQERTRVFGAERACAARWRAPEYPSGTLEQ